MIYSFIPARAGSSRLKDKNYLDNEDYILMLLPT